MSNRHTWMLGILSLAVINFCIAACSSDSDTVATSPPPPSPLPTTVPPSSPTGTALFTSVDFDFGVFPELTGSTTAQVVRVDYTIVNDSGESVAVLLITDQTPAEVFATDDVAFGTLLPQGTTIGSTWLGRFTPGLIEDPFILIVGESTAVTYDEAVIPGSFQVIQPFPPLQLP